MFPPWPCSPSSNSPTRACAPRRRRSIPRASPTPAFQQLLDDMFETMYEAPGIGLAASQVDVHQRFMVIDVTEDKDQPLVFINPEITARDGEQVYQEGCLSVPGIFADVTRADADHGARRSTATASRSSSRPTACWRCASSTRWTTWTASCSSTTSRRSSARWCARSWPSSAATPDAPDGRRRRPRPHAAPSESRACGSSSPARRNSPCPACAPPRSATKWSPSTPSPTARPGAGAG